MSLARQVKHGDGALVYNRSLPVKSPGGLKVVRDLPNSDSEGEHSELGDEDDCISDERAN